MTRRKLITLLGSLIAAPVAHPFVARADRTRRIGLLINLRSDDPEGQNRLMAFVQALQKFGWTEGSNIHIDLRWASDDADLSRRYAEELVALAPDVVLVGGNTALVAFQQANSTLPIVFAMIRTEHVRKFAHCRKCGAQTRAAPPLRHRGRSTMAG